MPSILRSLIDIKLHKFENSWLLNSGFSKLWCANTLQGLRKIKSVMVVLDNKVHEGVMDHKVPGTQYQSATTVQDHKEEEKAAAGCGLSLLFYVAAYLSQGLNYKIVCRNLTESVHY